MSKFMSANGLQTPLFPRGLCSSPVCPGPHVTVSPGLAGCLRCPPLLYGTEPVSGRHRSLAPVYTPGQKVWLLSKELPLQIDSKKLAPRCIGPFDIIRMINLTVDRLKLLSSLKVYSLFHVCLTMPTSGQTPFSITNSFPLCVCLCLLAWRQQQRSGAPALNLHIILQLYYPGLPKTSLPRDFRFGRDGVGTLRVSLP